MVLTDANALFAPHQPQGSLPFTNVDADANQQHIAPADPQLAISRYCYDVLDDGPADQFTFTECIWGSHTVKTDESMGFFSTLDAMNQHYNTLDMHISNTSQVDIPAAAIAVSLETGPSFPRLRTSSQSSHVSASSASSLDQKRGQQISRQLQKQHVQHKSPPVPFQQRQQEQERAQSPLRPLPPGKAAKSWRSTTQPRQAKTSRASQPIVTEQEAENVDKSTRSKFRENNKMAASKSRQKKKQSIQELEDTKADLEKRRCTLQGNYIALLEELSEVKNQLMAHSGCHDINIDKWIEREAIRFVYRATPPQITPGNELLPQQP
jgi:predicted  nucleic acid-binding Zn-ribbon protein